MYITKVPDDWESGMVLSLYHDGFTITVPANSKLSTHRISYDESDFIRFILVIISALNNTYSLFVVSNSVYI